MARVRRMDRGAPAARLSSRTRGYRSAVRASDEAPSTRGRPKASAAPSVRIGAAHSTGWASSGYTSELADRVGGQGTTHGRECDLLRQTCVYCPCSPAPRQKAGKRPLVIRGPESPWRATSVRQFAQAAGLRSAPTQSAGARPPAASKPGQGCPNSAARRNGHSKYQCGAAAYTAQRHPLFGGASG